MDSHKVNRFQEGSTSIKGSGYFRHTTVHKERSSMKWQEIDRDIVPTTVNLCSYSWECSEKSFLLQALLFSHMSCPCLKYGRSVEEGWFNVFFYPLSHIIRLIPQRYNQCLVNLNKKRATLIQHKILYLMKYLEEEVSRN